MAFFFSMVMLLMLLGFVWGVLFLDGNRQSEAWFVCGCLFVFSLASTGLLYILYTEDH